MVQTAYQFHPLVESPSLLSHAHGHDLILLTLLLVSYAMNGHSAEQARESVVIDYFFEATCKECKLIKEGLLPQIAERFGGFYQLNLYDISRATNIARLVTCQERLKVSKNEPVMMVLDYSYALNGFNEIKTGLVARIDECIAARQEEGWKIPVSVEVDAAGNVVQERMKMFTLPVIIFNGFIDGLNPCAISTLVFFMSLLSVAKVRGSALLALGISYTVATFVVYTAIGLGLLEAIRYLNAFNTAGLVIKYLMATVLVALASISFRDAYRFRISGRASDITLQLPDGIKGLTHRIMKRGLSHGSLLVGGLIIGALVTVLESVCTGQAYLPTLVYIIKSGTDTSTAWTYLLIYNAMFVIPLVLAFTATYYGTRSEKLLDWSRSNVVPAKVALGILFLAIAGLMLLTQ